MVEVPATFELQPRQRIAAIKKHCRSNPQVLLRRLASEWVCSPWVFPKLPLGLGEFFWGRTGKTPINRSPFTTWRLLSKATSSPLSLVVLPKLWNIERRKCGINGSVKSVRMFSQKLANMRRKSQLDLTKRVRVHEKGGMEGMSLTVGASHAEGLACF